jgi:hypothetical protein
MAGPPPTTPIGVVATVLISTFYGEDTRLRSTAGA